jgi:hypothetical protein
MKETIVTEKISNIDSGYRQTNTILIILLSVSLIGGGYLYYKTQKALEEVKQTSLAQVESITNSVDSLLNCYTMYLDQLGAIRDTVYEKHYKYHTKFIDRWHAVTIQTEPEVLRNSLEEISKTK